MLANMKATGRSSEETHAALAQFFLNCPAVDPDAEQTKVNVDEFEHTEVEQQARRDQQRVLMALARRNRQPVPMADGVHFDPTERREHRRDPEVHREGNDVTQAAFQSPYAQDVDDATPDEGGAGVGCVASQQTQDTGANFFGANPNAPPLQLANDSENMQRALRRRAEYMRYLAMEKDADRVRQSIADKPDSDDLRGNFTEEDDSHYKANDRRWEYREWCDTRRGYLKDHYIDMYMTREDIHRPSICGAAPRQGI
jgi:hypothetical protein